MASIGTVKVDAVKMLTDNLRVQIHVRRLNEVRFRLWLGSLLIRFAAWVLPASVSVDVE